MKISNINSYLLRASMICCIFKNSRFNSTKREHNVRIPPHMLAKTVTTRTVRFVGVQVTELSRE